MKQITKRLPIFLFLVVMILLVTYLLPATKSICDTGLVIDSPGDALIPSRCSVFTVSRGEKVFFGGNDDYIDPDSYYWVDPGSAEKYGAIWVGQPDNVQQGVNERGLAYDANGLPSVNVHPHVERIQVSGSYTRYPIHILHECATVNEVITWVNTHQWHTYMHDQMHFADATGDAVIISAARDGELAFTRKPQGNGFLVSTNFNVANPSNGFGYPCWRYDLAQALLDRLVNQEGELTAQDAANVLDAVHQQGGAGWTVSSLVADLPHGVVYLYYFHQFDRPVVLNVEKELANPRTPGSLSELFPDDVRQEATRRYQQIQSKAMRCRWAGMAWLTIDLVSLVLLFVLPISGRRGLKFWVPAVILLGPLALLVMLICGRRRQPGRWCITIMEALGDIMPTLISFIVVLIILIQIPAVQRAQFLQLVLWLCFPLLVGWLVFHGPLLTAVTDKSDGRFLGQRLAQVLVVANMGMGGISIVAMPLVNQSLRTCSILPLTAWTILTLWVIAVLGALMGGLLISLYEYWAVKGGFQAWSILACSEGKVRTPTWRKLWWWIVLSYVALFGGIAVGVVLQQMLSA